MQQFLKGENLPTVPLTELISSDHYAINISTWLNFTASYFKRVTGKDIIISCIIIDDSAAMIRGVCCSIGFDLVIYINKLWNKETVRTRIMICKAHIRHSFSRMDKKHFPNDAATRKFLVAIMSSMQIAICKSHLVDIYKLLVNILSCKFKCNKFSEAIKTIKN